MRRQRFPPPRNVLTNWPSTPSSGPATIWRIRTSNGCNLPLQKRVHDFTIVHATLDTPGQWGYVFSNLDAVASFTYQRTAVCFFGHTHVPMVFLRDQGVRQKRIEHV